MAPIPDNSLRIMGKKKKKKKKAGCGGLLVNFIITLICLVVTALILYLVYITLTSDEPVDPADELKRLPERMKELWAWIQGLLEGSGGEGGDKVIEPDPIEPDAPAEAPVSDA